MDYLFEFSNAITFSQDKLGKVTVFGAGLLVGTALAVIIPEGVRSLIPQGVHHAFNQSEEVHEQNDPLSVIGISLILGFIFMLLVDQVRFMNIIFVILHISWFL